MNKQLIKDNMEAFTHWINGGKLLVFYPQDTDPAWLTPDPEEADDPWNFPEVSIVIDDEYVEFRKALAEGKIIQHFIKSAGADVWEDTTTLYIGFGDHLGMFRIKPDEPKFKVGDWVQHIESSSTYGSHILKIEEIDERNELLGFVSLIGQGKTIHSNLAELWKPQPGEWVVYNICEDNFQVGRYIEEEKGGHFIEGTSYLMQYVEPFTGNLPTTLKDSQ